jgi:helix-turn-helix resolvase-like protein
MRVLRAGDMLKVIRLGCSMVPLVVLGLAQQLYDAGEHTVQQIADIFGVPRSTVYGHLDKASIGKRPAVAVDAPDESRSA